MKYISCHADRRPGPLASFRLRRPLRRLLTGLLLALLPAVAIAGDPDRLEFHDTPLSEAVAEIGRTFHTRVIYSDRVISGIAVSGRVHRETLVADLTDLVDWAGLRVERMAANELVLWRDTVSGRRTIRGRVLDGESGAPLSSANITLSGSALGAVTDSSGAFRIDNIPAEAAELLVEYLGYRRARVRLAETGDSDTLIVAMTPDPLPGRVVTVFTPDSLPGVSLSSPHRLKLVPGNLVILPTLGGGDPLRSIQLLTGIGATHETSAGLHIRGGRPEQNLLLFDGIPLFQPDHIAGFLSTINLNAVESVRIHRSGYPARFGGRTSGVLDMRSRSGSRHSRAGLGMDLLSIRGHALLPVFRGGSLSIAARRSYSDVVHTPLSTELFNQMTLDRQGEPPATGTVLQQGLPDLRFADLQARLELPLGRTTLASVSTVLSSDRLGRYEQTGMREPQPLPETAVQAVSERGTAATGMQIARYWSRNASTRLHLSYSRYRDRRINASRELIDIGGEALAWRNRIERRDARIEHEWNSGHRHRLSGGLALGDTRIEHGLVRNDSIAVLKQGTQGREREAWVEHQWRPARFEVTSGLRVSAIDGLASPIWQPRVAVRYAVNTSLSLHGALGRFHQAVKQVRPDVIDRRYRPYWMLGGAGLPVERADHRSVGFRLQDGPWSGDATLYWKRVDGISEFSVTPSLEGKGSPLTLYEGSDRIRGLELALHREHGPLHGWISYTLSRLERRLPGLLNDAAFTAGEERRHDLKVVGLASTGSWRFAATWVYASGKPFTNVEGQYYITLMDGTVQRYFDLSRRNAGRLPAYHRLDLRLARRFRLPRVQGEAGLAVFNAYGRRNIGYRDVNPVASPVAIADVALMGMMPNLFLNLELR